jgi:hypothetical protein
MTNELVSSKYTFACDPDECDVLIELTSSDGFGFPSGVMEITCPCGRKPTLLSVEHATLTQTTTKEETMETATINYPEVIASLENRIKSLEYANGNLNTSVNNYYTKEQRLRSYLSDNAEDMEHHAQEIAQIFDIPLTREVEFEATITVRGTVELEIFGGIELDEYITDVLTVDSYNGDVSIFDYTVDNVTEN